MLTQGQKDQFWRDGYLVIETAVTQPELEAMRRQVGLWVEESRSHDTPYGTPTTDGKPRFDMGAEHRADHPALRRVNNPSDFAPSFQAAAWNSAMVDAVADLIGPNVKFHHCKINLKLPGTNTEVGYHQDYAYTPHSNDDLVTGLLMLDDMTEDNGCLTVVPGSHRGPIHSLYEGERFTGAVAPSVQEAVAGQVIKVTGKAGGACLMHTALLHGSAANHSGRSRGLYICVYAAADAAPLCHNVMANPNEGKILRGQTTRKVRLVPRDIELPPAYKTPSFFVIQGQKSATREAKANP